VGESLWVALGRVQHMVVHEVDAAPGCVASDRFGNEGPARDLKEANAKAWRDSVPQRLHLVGSGIEDEIWLICNLYNRDNAQQYLTRMSD
jgi:hypothetical protein